MSHEQTLIPQAQDALAVTSEPSVGQMLGKFIETGVTKDNVDAFAKLIELRERMEQRDAEKAFNAAFVRLQMDLPVIVAKTVIPNRGKYERFEDVMEQVGPALKNNGFSVSFSMDSKDGRVVETCHLRHIAGHSQSNSFAVRVGRADTETQADCKAATTAKRNALLNALNVVIRQDAMHTEDDASIEGEFIPDDKQAYLREQVADVGFNEATFFKLAGCSSYDQITQGKYPVLINALNMKRGQR